MSNIHSYNTAKNLLSDSLLNNPHITEEGTICLHQLYHTLLADGFSSITPIRFGYIHTEEHSIEDGKQQIKVYQGLVKVTADSEKNDNNVLIIKWQQACHTSLAINDNSSLSSVSFNNQTNGDAFLYEVSVLEQLTQYNNVVQPITVVINSQNQQTFFNYYAMPFYPLGDVKKFLARVIKGYSIEDCIKIKIQLVTSIAKSIIEFHTVKAGGNEWLHGDIKPGNIIVTRFNNQHNNWNIEVKLIDFAVAEKFGDSRPAGLAITVSGTPAYLAPECWEGQPKTHFSDYYAFGIMMYEIFMGKRPITLNKQNNLTQSQKLTSFKKYHDELDKPKLHSDYTSYQDALNYLLSKKPSQRLKGMDLLMNITIP